jgi:hypothetical protein
MGRGEYHRPNAKISTADLHCVRLADFKKQKCFAPGHPYSLQWSRYGEKVASVTFTVTDSSIRFRYAFKDWRDGPVDVDKTIPFTLTPCYFGGHRKWFLCGCGRKVATIFIHDQWIACRHCFHAVYPSQREGADAIDRKWRKISKLQDKLRDGWCRPKGMHMRTYDRIKDELMRTHIQKDQLFESEFSCRFRRGLE